MTETLDVLGAPMIVMRDAGLFLAEQPIPPSRQAAPAPPRARPIQEAAHAGAAGAVQPSADEPTSGQTSVDVLQARLDALQRRLEARSERSS